MRCTIALLCLLALGFCTDAAATRRGTRIDQGFAWSFPYDALGSSQCPDSSSANNRVNWRGFEFAGLALAVAPPNSFCQYTYPGINGSTNTQLFENANFPGLIGDNRDDGVSGMRYTFNINSGFQWEFYSFPKNFTIVALNGLVGVTLGSSTAIRRDGTTLWSAADNQFSGEFFCFKLSSYLGLWDGTFNNLQSPCVQQMIADNIRPGLVSRTQLGEPVNGNSFDPTGSADARWVAYVSRASDFSPGGIQQVVLLDRALGTSRVISRTPSGVAGTGDSSDPYVSANSQYLAFTSRAPNLHPNGQSQAAVYLWSLQTQALQLIQSSVGVDCYATSISADGELIATTCVTAQFMRTLSTYRRSSGLLETVHATAAFTHGGIIGPDPQFYLFDTSAALVPNDQNGLGDVYLRRSGVAGFERISVGLGTESNNHSFPAGMTADGCRVVFHSDASNLVTGDTNNNQDVFVRNRCQNTTIRISVNAAGQQLNGGSSGAALSSNGEWVGYLTTDPQLVIAAGTSEYAPVVRATAGVNSSTILLRASNSLGYLDSESLLFKVNPLNNGTILINAGSDPSVKVFAMNFDRIFSADFE